MNKTTIKIDSNKLRSLLENTANKSIYEIALESGYSKNVISNALREGYASSAVQNIARLYGITPDMYKAKDPEPIKEPAQISIDDIETLKKDELKNTVKRAICELIHRDDLKELIREVIREERFKVTVKEALREELLIAIDGGVIIKRGEDLKTVIRQVIYETPFVRATGVDYDPNNKRFKLIVNEEDLK